MISEEAATSSTDDETIRKEPAYHHLDILTKNKDRQHNLENMSPSNNNHRTNRGFVSSFLPGVRSYLQSPHSRNELLCSFLYGILSCNIPKKFIAPFLRLSTRVIPIPYQITSSGDVLLDLNLAYDMPQTETVTAPRMIFLSFFLPCLLICWISFRYPSKRVSYGHSSICALFVAAGSCEFWTGVAKLYIGRLRPNFYAMCQFDVATLQCLADVRSQQRSRQSFPSGHASMSFCGMTVLSLFLAGRIFGTKGGANMTFRKKVCAILAVTMPLGLATGISASRLVDHWHHPSDVIAGALLGIFCALMGYHMWLPPIFL